jgi:hypothetical protein
MSYGSTGVVIGAFTPALVPALRETGVAFAIALGVVILQERLTLARLTAIATALVGTTVLKLGRLLSHVNRPLR